ncbi:MAG TPA: YfcE family phosphodiesterase [Thermodesulfobacteriota bacterium]|nr:YfcE family phosphodiesterase [Thermodesulfobacteriota bacterium]
MKILIVSDIHANIEALKAINEEYDYLFCLGDLVDYGPSPRECISFIRNSAHAVVRGNHDNAVALRVDCKCSEAYRLMSVKTRELMREILNEDEINYLRSLPLNRIVELGGSKFFLTHATPTDSLFKYLPPDSPEYVWKQEIDGVDADFVLLGHTHFSMIRRIGKTTIINPGSVGQSKDIPGVASYAIWNNGEVEIKRVNYNINKTIEKIRLAPLDDNVKDSLITVLEHGNLRNLS